MKRILGLCLVAVVFLTGLLSGCADPNAAGTQGKEEVPLELKVKRLDQYTKFGGKRADGQYVLAQLSIKNDGVETMTMAPTEFFLQNITDDPAEQYTQAAEKFMMPSFMSVLTTSTPRTAMRFASSATVTVSPISTSGKPATMKRSPAPTASVSVRAKPAKPSNWVSRRFSGASSASLWQRATVSPRRMVPSNTRPMAIRPR